MCDITIISLSPSGARCSFPEFIWFLPPDTKERIWFTETKYLSNGLTWESRRKVVAKEGLLAVHMQHPGMCDEGEDEVGDNGEEFGDDMCVKSEVMHTISCMRSEGDKVYRVSKTGQG